MTATVLQFRIATAKDATRVHQLIETAFRAEDSRPNWTADMSLGRNFSLDIKHVIASINSPDKRILMACDENDDLLAGVEVAKREAVMGRLSWLSVDARHQQGGIGRRLVAYAEEYARRTWGVQTMGLNALSTREELMKWYMRCGYVKTGELTRLKVSTDSTLAGVDSELVFVEMEKRVM